MKMIARQEIIGAKTDAELEALDGIMYYENEADSIQDLIEKFEKDYPDFEKFVVNYEEIF